jgi:hypothetical protein
MSMKTLRILGAVARPPSGGHGGDDRDGKDHNRRRRSRSRDRDRDRDCGCGW